MRERKIWWVFKAQERWRKVRVRASSGRWRMRKKEKIDGALGFYTEEQFLNENGIPKSERYAVLPNTAS